MSHSQQLSLKLILHGEIRKVQQVPESYSALIDIVRELYGSTDFTIKYRDEEGDLITVACDEELRTATETVTGPSLKLTLIPRPQKPPETLPTPNIGTKDKLIKSFVLSEVSRSIGVPIPPVHPNVTCDGCGEFPLLGTRYKCTVCANFDYCAVCEAQLGHPHSFLQIKDPGADLSLDVVVDCASLEKSITRFLRPKKSKRLKMQFVRHSGLEELHVAPGVRCEKSWVVRNDGVDAWPPGTALVLAKGEVNSDRTVVPCIPPGAEGMITTTLRAPLFEGRYHSIFRLLAPCGKKFGEKLKVRTRVEAPLSSEYAEKVEQLRAMGFHQEEEIKSLLRLCGGDVSLVAARLLGR